MIKNSIDGCTNQLSVEVCHNALHTKEIELEKKQAVIVLYFISIVSL